MAIVEGAGGGGYAGGYDISGYNKDKVEQVERDIKKTYTDLIGEITQMINDTLVTPMSKVWFAPEAKTEFDDIYEAIKKMGESMADAYKHFGNWTNQMGSAWAEKTGGKAPEKVDIEEKGVLIAKDRIQDQKSGNIQLDENEALKIAGRVFDLRKTILKKVRDKHDKLEAGAALIGHGQGTAARNCFVNVSDALDKLFAIMETLSDRIKQHADNYRKVAEEVANQLNNAQITVN